MNIHIPLENSVFIIGIAARVWIINLVSEIIVLSQFWTCGTTVFLLTT